MVKLRIPKATRFTSSSSSSGGSSSNPQPPPPPPFISYQGEQASSSSSSLLAQDNSQQQQQQQRRSIVSKKKKVVASILDSPRRMLMKHRLSIRNSPNASSYASSSSPSTSSSRAIHYQQGQRREHRDELSTVPINTNNNNSSSSSAFVSVVRPSNNSLSTSSLSSSSPLSTPTMRDGASPSSHQPPLSPSASALNHHHHHSFTTDLALPSLDDSHTHNNNNNNKNNTCFNIRLEQRVRLVSNTDLYSQHYQQQAQAQAQAQQNNVLHWMQEEAPQDILPKILSFAGSRKMDVLSRLNKHWRELVLSEFVWRTACEDTRKWSEGDPIPSSWLQLYKDTPCVPMDYDRIETAFDSICHGSYILDTNVVDSPGAAPRHYREQKRNVRLLIQPGRYILRESLIVHTLGDAEVTIESMEAIPSETRTMMDSSSLEGKVGHGEGHTATTKRLNSSSLMDILTCRSSSATTTGTPPPDDMLTAVPPESNTQDAEVVVHSPPPPPPPRRATIVLKTRKHNEPIIRVRQGRLNLNKLQLLHNCHGTDIWNGNSAVQVQPAFDAEDNPIRAQPPSTRPPTAMVKGCDITSFSGRGVVNIDGGKSTVSDCYIHHCAATGVYVGGPGSVATIERTDVLENGNGNQRSRRGIARGHSGIYLEQGVAIVRDCNISNNSLTGISAISTDNARLRVEESDLIANGSIQLEMPPNGSISRQRSIARNNRMMRQGEGRSRSGLMFMSEEENNTTTTNGLDAGRSRRQQLGRVAQNNDAALQEVLSAHAAAAVSNVGGGGGGGGGVH